MQFHWTSAVKSAKQIGKTVYEHAKTQHTLWCVCYGFVLTKGQTRTYCSSFVYSGKVITFFCNFLSLLSETLRSDGWTDTRGHRHDKSVLSVELKDLEQLRTPAINLYFPLYTVNYKKAGCLCEQRRLIRLRICAGWDVSPFTARSWCKRLFSCWFAYHDNRRPEIASLALCLVWQYLSCFYLSSVYQKSLFVLRKKQLYNGNSSLFGIER